jgi:type I restriction enzyme S subunit
MADVITQNLAVWTSALESKSTFGRETNNKQTAYGIKKLRELILELAVRGKLVPQDPNDESASELLKRIQAEKDKLIAEVKIKKDKPLAAITEDEKPFELPDGWEWTRLGEITNFGVTEKLELISDDTWVLDLEDIEKDTSKLIQKFRFSERRSLSSKNSFQAGDVLYGKLRPYLNKVVVADEAGVCTTEILPVRCYGPFSSNYFKFTLKSPYFINYVNARSYGMKMPRLGTEDGRKAYFPLPPLAEQQRIVAKVDELMALCDQLEQQQTISITAHQMLVGTLLKTLTESENAEQLAQNWAILSEHFDTLFTTEHSIDQLKQTLLQLAVMGKLVPQDPNDEPASELYRRIQVEKAKLTAEGKIKKDKALPPITDEEKPFRLPEGWEWARLQSVIDVRDGTHDSPKEAVGLKTYPLVTSKDFVDGDINFDTAKKISETDHLEISKRSLVEKYDILFSMIGGNIGNQVMVNDDRPFSVKNVALFKYYDKSLTLPFFIKKYTENLAVSLQSTAIGGAQPFVALGALRNLIIALPPLVEQHRIVAKVDELMALCDTLKAQINKAQTTQVHLADAIVEQAIA